MDISKAQLATEAKKQREEEQKQGKVGDAGDKGAAKAAMRFKAAADHKSPGRRKLLRRSRHGHHTLLRTDAASKPPQLSDRMALQPPASPVTHKECETTDSSESQQMKCRYVEVWDSQFECGNMIVTPSKSIQKLVEYVKGLYDPETGFQGTVQWCEDQKALLRARLIPLVKAGNLIIGKQDEKVGPSHNTMLHWCGRVRRLSLDVIGLILFDVSSGNSPDPCLHSLVTG